MGYTDINAETIDRWVENGWEWGVPISQEQFRAAVSGDWQMLLTPVKPVPREWFPPLRGAKVLGLASGGGQQMPIFAAQGAECTVLDYSERQLESERMVAAREGYAIEIVRADMTKPLPFPDASFDLIFHPVSNCYIEDVQHVWDECFRILRPGGLLMAGLDNGFNFLFGGEDEQEIRYSLPFNPLRDPKLMEELRQSDSGVQFSHTLEEQIRGQIRAGFRLLDLYEDTNGSGFLHEHGVPTFWATLAQK
ncbi:MAG TPA: class I SAM-dependent methyltransferase [Candidatus Gallacutalibacter pullicola]|uniref:Class I SAM-dependent methyltransferase n=1 Tax=Candidatus Gallacutalibacter pullicola TaxID=2840830 RepID=A0A9D1J131_9FIRM|nr:class I SAM-dependent methyltransferase [Candidatus Gallacutalibacter pullicola]